MTTTSRPAPRRSPPPRVAAEGALARSAPRIVRVPWVYGPGGLARDLIVGLRTRRYRIVGPGRQPAGRCWRRRRRGRAGGGPRRAAGRLQRGRGRRADAVRGGRRGLRACRGHPPPGPRAAGPRRAVDGRGHEPGPRHVPVDPHRPRSPTTGGRPRDDWRTRPRQPGGGVPSAARGGEADRGHRIVDRPGGTGRRGCRPSGRRRRRSRWPASPCGRSPSGGWARRSRENRSAGPSTAKSWPSVHSSPLT